MCLVCVPALPFLSVVLCLSRARRHRPSTSFQALKASCSLLVVHRRKKSSSAERRTVSKPPWITEPVLFYLPTYHHPFCRNTRLAKSDTAVCMYMYKPTHTRESEPRDIIPFVSGESITAKKAKDAPRRIKTPHTTPTPTPCQPFRRPDTGTDISKHFTFVFFSFPSATIPPSR
jgi:hypothetical protein